MSVISFVPNSGKVQEGQDLMGVLVADFESFMKGADTGTCTSKLDGRVSKASN